MLHSQEHHRNKHSGNTVVSEESPKREVKKLIFFSAKYSGYTTFCLLQIYVNPGLPACMLILQHCDTGLVS